jgi:E3 ubiquitin-protein ligase DOA10
MTSAECRFCLETDTIDNLLSPCSCKGSSKYVHNDCLMNWYTAEPSRGIRCNSCLSEYDREGSHSIESLHTPHIFVLIKMNHPLFSILVCHWILILMFNTSRSIISLTDTNLFYICYQVVNQLYVFYELSGLVYHVKNKYMYMKMWLTRDCIMLMFLHSYLLATLPETTWIGGMAAEYVTCLYFYTHYKILETINRNYTFRFLSR